MVNKIQSENWLDYDAVIATPDTGSAGGRRSGRRLVGSSRTHGSGPSRHLFEVSRAGARALAETHAMRERLWQGVDVRRLMALASG